MPPVQIHICKTLCRAFSDFPRWKANGCRVRGAIWQGAQPQSSIIILQILCQQLGTVQGEFCQGVASDEAQLICIHFQDCSGLGLKNKRQRKPKKNFIMWVKAFWSKKLFALSLYGVLTCQLVGCCLRCYMSRRRISEVFFYVLLLGGYWLR